MKTITNTFTFPDDKRICNWKVDLTKRISNHTINFIIESFDKVGNSFWTLLNVANWEELSNKKYRKRGVRIDCRDLLDLKLNLSYLFLLDWGNWVDKWYCKHKNVILEIISL